MASFYEGDGDQGMDLGVPPPEAAAADPTAAAAGPPAGGGPAAAGKINFVSGGDDDSSDEGEDGQAFFAGGSTNSGNVVCRNMLCWMQRRYIMYGLKPMFRFLLIDLDIGSQEEKDK